jgi:hypothetical protein
VEILLMDVHYHLELEAQDAPWQEPAPCANEQVRTQNRVHLLCALFLSIQILYTGSRNYCLGVFNGTVDVQEYRTLQAAVHFVGVQLLANLDAFPLA